MSEPKHPEESLPPILTAEELFAFLRLGPTAGYLALSRGDFPFAVKIGRLWRFPRDAMLAWLAKADAYNIDQ